MAKCGEYELDRAIGWGRRSTFFSARAIDDRGPALIVIRRARSGESAISQAFLRAAAEQQTAVAAGCRRIAPILAFERDEAGFPFYATTRYETSLAEFLEAECKVDSALLRENVTSVLGALAELHEKSRRAHGNLTPGNILLDPQGRIFLTDLAPSAKEGTTADDLFALGKLIYQLVRRTTRIGTLNPPLDYSQAWTDSLGDDAEGWLAFTNHLLDKPRNAAPEAIKSALGDLKSLASLATKAAKATQVQVAAQGEASQPAVRRAPPKKRSPLPIVLAVIAALAGGGGYLWYADRKAKDEKREAARKIQKAIDEHNATLPSAVKNLSAQFEQLPKEIEIPSTLHSRLQKIRDSIRDGTWTQGSIQTDVSEWRLPGEMKKMAGKWSAAPLEWKTLADEMEKAGNISLTSDKPLVEQARDAIVFNKAAGDLEILWKGVEYNLKELSNANNPLLPDFTSWAEHKIRDASDLKEALKGAQEARNALAKVVAFQSDSGKRVRWARLEKEVPDIRQKTGEEWMEKAKAFIAPEQDKVTQWETKLASFEARFQELSTKDPKRPEWDRKLKATREAITEPLESQAPTIEKQLLEFEEMRTQMEIAHDDYRGFLEPWQKEVLALSADDPEAKNKANALLKKFGDKTAALLRDYKLKLKPSPAESVSTMQRFLDTKERINLKLPKDIWTEAKVNYTDADAASYNLVKDGRPVAGMHFLKVNDSVAMAAWETPLVLARHAGSAVSRLSPDGKGPRIRSDDFSALPTYEWIWKAPKDFLLSKGKQPGEYFAPGVGASDIEEKDALKDYLPATWLTYDEADAMAKALGGRLPTAGEWRAAYTKRPGAEKRLRSDAAWTRQYKQYTEWQKGTGDPMVVSTPPDYGSFSKSIKEGQDDKSSAGGSPADNKLWLDAVLSKNWEPKSGFTHLVGNAAEWVTGDDGKPAVIGASVVSPKLPPERAFSMGNNVSFFDVTFRLVVELGEGGAGVGLKNFMQYAGGLTAP